jgi:hypothetical protein
MYETLPKSPLSYVLGSWDDPWVTLEFIGWGTLRYVRDSTQVSIVLGSWDDPWVTLEFIGWGTIHYVQDSTQVSIVLCY